MNDTQKSDILVNYVEKTLSDYNESYNKLTNIISEIDNPELHLVFLDFVDNLNNRTRLLELIISFDTIFDDVQEDKLFTENEQEVKDEQTNQKVDSGDK